MKMHGYSPLGADPRCEYCGQSEEEGNHSIVVGGGPPRIGDGGLQLLKYRLHQNPSKLAPYGAHEHVMHIVLNPSKWRFKNELNMDSGMNVAWFQYEGVNLYTHFIWDGTAEHHDEVKQGHMAATIKYLARHGITAEVGL